MKKEEKNSKFTRSPIVVILGHVDHGKTTLLDFIRKTKVAKREAGGITQSTGASVAETKEGEKITFIDTPGHAAFAKMRSRGASVADIAILVVAGEEGVKPQTEEALNYILDAKIPYIVAITKIDLPTASFDKVRTQMEKLGVSFEGRGGDVPLIKVSSKTGEGVDALLDLIVLTSEIHGLEGGLEDNFEGVVIETVKDKKGPTVSCVIKSGKLKVGEDVVTDTVKARVRGIFDSTGGSVKEVFPGEPALLLGFQELPVVGSRVWSACDKDNIVVSKNNKKAVRSTEGEVLIILKANNTGCIEAITANLPQGVSIVDSGIGDVTGSDVFLAKSTKSTIFVFESKVGSSVKKLAETEEVKIMTFDVVYELFEKLEELINEGKIEVKGKAKIVATFPYNKKSVAGCNVLTGAISKKDKVILSRDSEEIGEVKISSMKKGKQDVEEVKKGEECGILFSPELDFKVSDVLLSYNSSKSDTGS